MTHILVGASWHIVASWHISCWHVIFRGVMTHIGASWQIPWRHGSYRDVMTYIVVAWHISWRHDTYLGVMVHRGVLTQIVAAWHLFQHIMLPFKAKFSCNTLVSLQRVFNTHILRQMLPTFWFIANRFLFLIVIAIGFKQSSFMAKGF